MATDFDRTIKLIDKLFAAIESVYPVKNTTFPQIRLYKDVSGTDYLIEVRCGLDGKSLLGSSEWSDECILDKLKEAAKDTLTKLRNNQPSPIKELEDILK